MRKTQREAQSDQERGGPAKPPVGGKETPNDYKQSTKRALQPGSEEGVKLGERVEEKTKSPRNPLRDLRPKRSNTTRERKNGPQTEKYLKGGCAEDATVCRSIQKNS